VTETKVTRPPSSTYWLVAKNDNSRMEVLTIDCDGKEALSVFSFREEAEMFIWLGGFEESWRVRESRAGEIVSVLMGLCAGVGYVVLDPLPKMVAEKMVGLVRLDRESFLRDLLGEREFRRSLVRREAPGRDDKRDRHFRLSHAEFQTRGE
jgi:hypothetical protein